MRLAWHPGQDGALRQRTLSLNHAQAAPSISTLQAPEDPVTLALRQENHKDLAV